MGQFIDLSGQKFKEITVIEKDIELSKEKKRVYWKCQCSCGRIKSIRADNLKKIQTCGECANDLTNQRFGRLIVLKKGKKDKAQHQYWICQCDCGNTAEINSDNLRRGLTQSCGCLHSEIISSLFIEDLTGQTFGKLTVLQKDNNIGERVKWLCKCECGNLIAVQANNLKSGHTHSCGCINSLGEQIIGKILQENNILFHKEFIFKDLPNRRFDFAILNTNAAIQYLIEFDGKQHFQFINTWHQTEQEFINAQQRDLEKNKYCLQNNIPLIRIPYYDIDKINIQELIPTTSKYLIKE